ncbi:hypothetical protein Tco_1134548 [Tanacetum coccineum]
MEVGDDNTRTRIGKCYWLTTANQLGEVTRVMTPSLTTIAIITHSPRYLVNIVSSVIAQDILLGIVEWSLGIFVSTTFIPLLGIEPSDLGFSYEIKIASGQLVEIDKLSDHKAEIICHEKVVRIPLLDGKEIVFRIELIPGATPVAKSPYRLSPSELEELPRRIEKL